MRIGPETYALPITSIREILTLPTITFVPRAPPEIMGIVSVRGQLVTVTDLRARLRHPTPPPGNRARVLLSVDGHGETRGLLVDEVLSVYRLSAGEIEPANTALGGNVADYVSGIGRQGDTMLILLAPAPLLDR